MDYSILYKTDRVCWCLYQLTKDPDDLETFDHAVVLQHLDDFLASHPRAEFERIDEEIFHCLTNLVSVARMLDHLNLHRPKFRQVDQDVFLQDRPAWHLWASTLRDPRQRLCSTMNLGSSINPLNKFRTPKGRKDEKWLAQRELAVKNLGNMWEKART